MRAVRRNNHISTLLIGKIATFMVMVKTTSMKEDICQLIMFFTELTKILESETGDTVGYAINNESAHRVPNDFTSDN